MSVSPTFDPSTFRIIPYTPDREEEVIDLFLAGMHENKALIHSQTHLESFQRFLVQAVQGLRNPPPAFTLFILVTPSNELVAMAALSYTPENASQKTAEFSTISVAKNWRRRGLCKMLLAHLVRVGVQKFHVETFYLYTASFFHHAVGTYEQLGFQIVGYLEGSLVLKKMVLNVAEQDWWRE